MDNRDMVLWARGGQLEQISQNSPSYSALHYVLLFPKGENGWHPRILIHGAQLREQGENARQRDREKLSQTSFGHISTKSSTISTVSKPA